MSVKNFLKVHDLFCLLNYYDIKTVKKIYQFKFIVEEERLLSKAIE